MSFAEKNYDIIYDMYVNQKMSTRQIAEKLGVSASVIARAVKKYGISRSKSEAQRVALDTGRYVPPFKGKHLSDEHRRKISKQLIKMWNSMDEEKLKQHAKRSKEQWQRMSEEERKRLLEMAHQARRRAARDGSKLERFIRDELIKRGYIVYFHKKGMIINPDLEIDILLPKEKVAIEVNGPSHFLPIWGEDALKSQIKSDIEKVGLLINHGFCVIKVKTLAPKLKFASAHAVVDKINEIIQNIQKKFPPVGKRVFEIDSDEEDIL